MINLSNSEKQVIRALLKLRRFATINEISHKANMSWNTVNKIIRNLYSKKVLERKTISGLLYWKIMIHN